MGMVIEGRWKAKAERLPGKDGEFQLEQSRFRNWITPDGSAGPTGEDGFKAEPGRYHLYVARACPFAHRATIYRGLKRLEPLIGLSVTHWLLGEEGWTFAAGEGVVRDVVNDAATVHELYTRADPLYTGRATVPVLWDKTRATIVSNESADIVRMLDRAFDGLTGSKEDYYPEALRGAIDRLNDEVHERLNLGVYRAGFAPSQQAHEQAVRDVFGMLDTLEERLAHTEYLLGDRPTEADWRLFPTLLRFDPVYVTHFKCNIRRLADYPHLYGYARRLLDAPGVRATVDMAHIRKTYYLSHRQLNPSGLIPVGFPALTE